MRKENAMNEEETFIDFASDCKDDASLYRVFNVVNKEGFSNHFWARDLESAQIWLAENRGWNIDYSCGYTIVYFWAAFYSTWENYGGPEEGGWYYDAGELVALMPVQTLGEMQTLAKELEEKIKVRVTWKSFLTPGHAPRSFPEVIPHYE